MKKIIFVIALLLGITLAVADASAQSDLAMVDGVVTVGDESPLEGAQVIALAASDSAFLMSTTTDARGEFLNRRDNRLKCSFSKCAVTDLTSAGASACLCFAYRVCREIIVVHITLCFFFVNAVELLAVAYRA